MDIGRSCYATNMQFDAAGEIIVPIRWYFAADGAMPFDGYHLYGSDNWVKTGTIYLGPGERWDSLRPWSNGARIPPSPGTTDPCGQIEWWTQGCPSDAPPLEFTPAGLAPCCPQPPCQPWLGGGAPPYPTTTTPSWTDKVPDEPGGEDCIWFIQFGPIITLDAGTGIGMCGPSHPTTQVVITNHGTGARFQCTCQSYDPSTLTGTWLVPSGAPYWAGQTITLTFH